MQGWELVHRCAVQDDGDLWRAFVRHFEDSLWSGVLQALTSTAQHSCRERAEELVQDVYCHLLADDRRRLRGFRGTSDGEALRWLMRVAENVVRDALRAEQAIKRGGGAASESPPPGWVGGPPADPFERVTARERRRQFVAHCRSLLGERATRRNLAVLELALFDGLTSREIAARSRGRLASGSVDAILSRLRRRLAAAGIEISSRRCKRLPV